jgi:hypothetical protein
MRRRQPDPEYPDRPYVRDIYDAQLRGFPIFDGDAFEVYRVALTSPVGLTDDPEAVEVLRPLAQQARTWMEQNPDAVVTSYPQTSRPSAAWPVSPPPTLRMRGQPR